MGDGDTEISSVRVVGIGASAGGIDALREFFEATPADTGLAFVVIQHLDPNQPSHMADLLSRYTGMKVAAVEHSQKVRADHVYTIPPNKFIFLKEGKLHPTEAVKRDGLKMPIDFFLRSLAEEQRENAIAVLFSGSGSDGTLGIREIRGLAGLVIVQDPKTAQFDSMIEHALATGMVDYALPVRQIPGSILQYVGQHSTAQSSRPDSEVTQDGITVILDLLASQTKSDFRCYKPTTIHRRIQRRMGLNGINDIADYYRFLSEHPDEVAKLSKDMLIGVTSFFRDPEAFEELRDKVIAPLVQQKHNSDPLRTWVAGCATGEEAYSIAILLREEMARARKSFKLQVFASDIDPEALKGAREGIFPESIAADLSEERLTRFFIRQDDTYRVDKQVREAITFAPHNVLLDPPFFNMELISCRNLLIYIEPEVQKKVLDRFAFALRPGGYLFLGKSENPMEQSDVFEPIAKSSRIFRRNPSASVPIGGFAPRAQAPAVFPASPERPRPIKLSDLNQQVLLKHFNASIVLVDEHGEIRHFYGPTHRYLSHSFGDASLSLFEMADSRHSPRLRVALERAARENATVRLEVLKFSRDDATGSVNVTVMPIMERNSGTRLFAVIFEDTGAPVRGAPASTQETELHHDTLVARLEAENEALKEEIQETIDGFQTTHEEFTAANEEVLAINEELQSTNEELVSSKEELQSVNEELITTNNLLNDKIEELGKINDDLANFLNSSEVGTIFLDRKFCIRRFTPSAAQFMSVLSLDVGRPVSHFSNKFIDTDLVAIADRVLKTLIPVEKEVHTSDGLWYMMRCLPYRSLKDVIDGVVFTFTDVTRLKRSEEAMQEASDYAKNIIHTTREALVVLDPELKIVSANRAFYETFRVAPEDTENRLIYDLGNRQWDIPELRELLEEILPTNSVVQDFEVKHDFPSIGSKVMCLNARRVYSRERKEIRLILLAITDITERRRIEQRHEFSHELEQKGSEGTGELKPAQSDLLQDVKQRIKLEDQLRQAQKMESMGNLASGIAHDLNNILNIIQNYTSVLEHGDDSEQIQESVTAITETTKRGAALVQQLLTLARKTETKLESINANDLIQELSRLLKETFPRNIELVLDLDPSLPPVMADSNQITQVLLNLCVNARDAMPDGGKLTLKTGVVAGKNLEEYLESEGYVSITVTDTGLGMDENLQSRIFEPFFTTKGIGQGTGLGLAVVYGIVRSHDGFIHVESKPMHGTTFRLYFPVASAEK